MTEKLSDNELRVRDNLKRIFDTVENSKARLGLQKEIRVVAATKTVPSSLIRFAHACGLREAGENRVQELRDKWEEGAYEGMPVSFVGRLQQNKVKYLVGKVDLIQSLDSLPLAAEIEKRYGGAGLTCRVLVELNSGAEEAKGGVSPEDIPAFFDELEAFPHLLPCGLMTVAPFCENKDDYRPYFEKTERIFRDLCLKQLRQTDDPILSMGMSDNYEIALAFGATMIRPGRAIFGERK